MKRRFRLKGTADFKRVRHLGRSYAHPLIVLLTLPNGLEFSRFAVSAGRSVGNAVQRNRVKRVTRAAMASYIEQTKPGWDVVILTRRTIKTANYQDVKTALGLLLDEARLIDGPEHKP